MKLFFRLIAKISLILIPGILLAQDTIKPNISSLGFMSGKWTGKMEWGDIEENWSAPMGNCMMCSFRCVKDGKIVFYEFIVIEQSGDSVPAMKLRHFSPGSIAWEDKDKPYPYPMVSLQTNRVRFERPDKKTAMVFHRIDKDKMKVTLEREENGKWKVEEFNYTLTSR